MDRRKFLQSSSAFAGLSVAGLAGCKHESVRAKAPAAPALPFYDALAPIVPIRADEDRIFRITVCLRPFRAMGPRLDVEPVNDKYIVHNYGHGGSGWSLSWGSSGVAVKKAMEAAQGEREIAVIGAGALGLTSATLLQRAGAKVTIYAAELAPYTRSSRATGSWTPDSRIALANAVSPTFAADWESMARASFFMYQSYLGMAGNPVEWVDHYSLHEDNPNGNRTQRPVPEQHPFLHLTDRIADITPGGQLLTAGMHPFPVKEVYHSSTLMFNIADYSRQLMNDFYIAGGKFERREFHSPQEVAAVREKVIINCTGYGARALWSDESITPVRGQIAWLLPQDGVRYSMHYRDLYMLARRDGIVMQKMHSEEDGFGDSNETADKQEAHAAVAILRELYSRMNRNGRRSNRV